MITPTIIEIGFMQMDIYEHSWECMKFRKYAVTAMDRNRYWQMSMDLPGFPIILLELMRIPGYQQCV